MCVFLCDAYLTVYKDNIFRTRDVPDGAITFQQ